MGPAGREASERVTATSDPIDLEGLRRHFGERLITPSDAAYGTVRLVANGAIDRHPALIARAINGEDVVVGVDFARSSGMTLAVRSGGHSTAGHSTGDGVFVLDLSRMDGIDIDPPSRTAWVEPGVLAGDFTRAAHPHGLALSFGDTGSVAIGGLTLGGGIGWLVRKHGLTIDSLLAVQVVTADGRTITATADEHADLFWALRGGGGNFGVATRLKFRLHPLRQVLYGTIVLPATREVLGGLVEAALAAPDELTLMTAIMSIPPIDEIDPEHHGQLGVLVEVMWAGPIEEGRSALGPIRALGEALLDEVSEEPYTAAYPERPVTRDPWTCRAIFVPTLDDETIDIVMRHLAAPASPSALVHLRTLGGAVSRVPNESTAYGWRDQSVLLWIIADFTDRPASELPIHEAWAESFVDELRHKGFGTYVNFMGHEAPAAVRSAYPAGTWDRLRAVKTRYDPNNLFRLNQNVPPT